MGEEGKKGARKIDFCRSSIQLPSCKRAATMPHLIAPGLVHGDVCTLPGMPLNKTYLFKMNNLMIIN